MEKSNTLLYRPKSKAVLPPYSQARDEAYAELWKYSRQGCDMATEEGMRAAVKKWMVWRKRYYYTEELPIDIAPEYEECMWDMYMSKPASGAEIA